MTDFILPLAFLDLLVQFGSWLFGGTGAANAVLATAASTATSAIAANQNKPKLNRRPPPQAIKQGVELASVRPRSQGVNARRGKARSILGNNDNSSGLLS